LIEFCILLGNDAVPRIRKVGPIKAFKLITAHGTIEAALSAEPAIRKVAEEEIPGYLEMVKTARAVFGQLPEITEEMKVQIEQSEALMSQGGQSGEGAGAGMDHVERWLEEKHGVAFVDPAMPSRLEEYEDLDLP
jgi:flap endonuclease-1